MTDALTLAGQRTQVFTAQGPAGILALLPVPGPSIGESFATEIFSDIVIGLGMHLSLSQELIVDTKSFIIAIWSRLDAQIFLLTQT